MSETKQCLECGTDAPTDAATCGGCGGASFPEVVAEQAAYAAQAPQEPNDAALAAERRKSVREKAWETAVAAADGADEPQKMLTAFKGGARPENMCPACPGLECPCRDCWARAGYKAEAYDRSFNADEGRPLTKAELKALDEKASTEPPAPPPTQPAGLIGITEKGLAVMAEVEAQEARGETADLDKAIATVDAASTPATDLPSGPLAHDSDEPSPDLVVTPPEGMPPVLDPEATTVPVDDAMPAPDRKTGSKRSSGKVRP